MVPEFFIKDKNYSQRGIQDTHYHIDWIPENSNFELLGMKFNLKESNIAQKTDVQIERKIILPGKYIENEDLLQLYKENKLCVCNIFVCVDSQELKTIHDSKRLIDDKSFFLMTKKRKILNINSFFENYLLTKIENKNIENEITLKTIFINHFQNYIFNNGNYVKLFNQFEKQNMNFSLPPPSDEEVEQRLNESNEDEESSSVDDEEGEVVIKIKKTQEDDDQDIEFDLEDIYDEEEEEEEKSMEKKKNLVKPKKADNSILNKENGNKKKTKQTKITDVSTRAIRADDFAKSDNEDVKKVREKREKRKLKEITKETKKEPKKERKKKMIKEENDSSPSANHNGSIMIPPKKSNTNSKQKKVTTTSAAEKRELIRNGMMAASISKTKKIEKSPDEILEMPMLSSFQSVSEAIPNLLESQKMCSNFLRWFHFLQLNNQLRGLRLPKVIQSKKAFTSQELFADAEFKDFLRIAYYLFPTDLGLPTVDYSKLLSKNVESDNEYDF